MNRIVAIERKKLDTNRCYGVIVSQSASLTLLHYEYDFQFDGFVVMRTKDITLCVTSESNDYSQRLMRHEGLWETVPLWVKKLSIAGWPELLTGLIGKVVTLEDEARDHFHIGQLLKAEVRHAVIHDFDACGRLQDVEKLAYSRLTSLRFGNRYATIHAKYLTAEAR